MDVVRPVLYVLVLTKKFSRSDAYGTLEVASEMTLVHKTHERGRFGDGSAEP